MQIDQIDTFLDLCDTRSFNRTAERMGVTQSTVSGRISALERLVGARLFRRSRAGTDLTTAGLRLEPHARALRLAWVSARAAVAQSGEAATTIRIGIQHDLMEDHLAGWLAALREALPGSGFYVEADYSLQMCRDVESGALDLGIHYSPKPQADLHFETLGEVRYAMVSTVTDHLAAVKAQSYILPNYSPAFAQTHSALLPGLSAGSLSSGQAAALKGLLTALGGTTYLPQRMAGAMVAAGQARAVADAPVIRQPVFAAVHLRQRHRAVFRRMIAILRAGLTG